MNKLMIMSDETQYISQERFDEFKAELAELKSTKIPKIADRIDEARQMGDLSENAEYHSARDEMAWAQTRVKELERILSNSEIVSGIKGSDKVQVGSTITVKVNGKEKEYHIVGAHEADPLAGKISNESPLGEAFLGKSKGDKVEVKVPSGMQEYKITSIS